jgi:hypothetical protein
MAVRVSSAERLDDVLRHAGRREQAVEIGGHHARQSGFGRGRDVGGGRQTLVRGDREDADLALRMELQERSADVRGHHRDVARGKIGDARRRAFVGNVGDVLDADQLFEQLAGKVGHGAGAGRAVGQLGRIGAGVVDEAP